MKVFWILLFVLLLLGGCGLELSHHSPGSENQLNVNPAELAAFSSSVYAFTRKNCVGCHGNTQAPLFAVVDASAAYDASLPYVSFGDIPASEFVVRSQNGHCGIACTTDGTEMEAAIQSWASGELAAAPPPAVVGPTTAPLPIPAGLPTGNTYLTMKFPLGAFGAGFQGAIFEIDIQQFSADAYRFRNPRLVTAGLPVSVQRLGILLNGTLDPLSTNYYSVSTTVPAHANQALSAALMLTLLQDGNPDQLAIVFGALAN